MRKQSSALLFSLNLCARLHAPGVQLRDAGRADLPVLPAFAPRAGHPARIALGRAENLLAGARMSSSPARDRGVGGGEAKSRRDIRIFLQHPLVANEGNAVDFSAEQGHYLRKVMRVADGAEIKVFDGVSGEWWCRLEFVDKKAVRGVLTEQRRVMEREPDVWMLFAPVKGGGTEVIVQKATELGASKIVPVMTERTVVKAVRWDRLTHISLEASEQCERLSAPALLTSQPLAPLISDWPSDRWLVLCDETASGDPSSAEALQQIPPGSSCAVVVGPEGGWTTSELQMMRSVPNVVSLGLGLAWPIPCLVCRLLWRPLHVHRVVRALSVVPCLLLLLTHRRHGHGVAGPRILRADTAAIAAMSLVQCFVGDWSSSASGSAGPG